MILKELRTIYWSKGRVVMIDQRELPRRLRYIVCRNYREVASAIKNMAIRGAPAIGVAAAYALALVAKANEGKGRDEQLESLYRAAEVLRSTRPTAINLFWAIDRVLNKAEASNEIASEVLREAERMAQEDIEVNKKIGINGASLIPDGATLMTYCNAGALATVGYGTALGVVRSAVEQGKKVRVIVPETRPRLQGARLTAYELVLEGIDYRVISDNMAPFLISKGMISCVVLGADRVFAKTGHVINKIGTLGIALAAKYYNVPFYVAAPLSSFDFERTPQEVRIEERPQEEVLYVGRERIAPRGAKAINYAFDITPPDLITSIITERGVYRPEELKSLEWQR